MRGSLFEVVSKQVGGRCRIAQVQHHSGGVEVDVGIIRPHCAGLLEIFSGSGEILVPAVQVGALQKRLRITGLREDLRVQSLDLQQQVGVTDGYEWPSANGQQ